MREEHAIKLIMQKKCLLTQGCEPLHKMSLQFPLKIKENKRKTTHAQTYFEISEY